MGLTSEQLEAVKKEAEKYMDANEAFGKAAVALWNARISMAIATDDPEVIAEIAKEKLIGAAGGAWNGNCPGRKE